MADTDTGNAPWFQGIQKLLDDYKKNADDAQQVIQAWSDSPGTNRQEYRDALHLQTVSQLRDFQLGAGIIGMSAGAEQSLMQTNYDLTRRNDLDMENQKSINRVNESRNTADLNVRQTQVEGSEQRKGLEITESGQTTRSLISEGGATDRARISEGGATDRALVGERAGNTQAGIQANAALGGERIRQGGETDRALIGTRSAERQIGLTGREQRKGMRESGSQDRQSAALGVFGQIGGRYTDQTGNTYDFGRGTIGTTGDESRRTIETQADQERRSLAFDRANAARTAIANTRR